MPPIGMSELDKKSLSERDICTKFITPALTTGEKWDLLSQIRKEVYFTKGRVAEQKRIVARVEELLWQRDALESQLRQTRTLGAHLLDSTLYLLLAA